MQKYFLKFKNFISNKLKDNKYLLQDKHSFKPMLIEIEDRPVNPVGHFTLWAIVFMFFVVIAWLSFAKVDVVVTARGKLIPSGDVKTIQATYNGVIKNILVKEANMVKKGDLLVQLDTNLLDEQISSKQKEYDLLSIKVDRLTALLKNKLFLKKEFYDENDYLYEKNIFDNEKINTEKKLMLINEKILSLKEQIDILKLEKKNKQIKLKAESERLKRLEKVLDIIPKIQYETSKFTALSLKNEIKGYKNKLQALSNSLKELTHQRKLIFINANSEYYKQLNINLEKRFTIKSQLELLVLQKEKYNIISPVDGYILKLHINTKDGVVTPAQKLLTIVPNDVKILAKVDILNKDIGFVYEKMDSLVKVDTFDFQKYGSIEANVLNISNSSIERQNVGLVYEAVLELKQDYLKLNNKKKILKPGMSVSSEMKVGKRRVIEFFIYPAIKYLDEGLSIL